MVRGARRELDRRGGRARGRGGGAARARRSAGHGDRARRPGTRGAQVSRDHGRGPAPPLCRWLCDRALARRVAPATRDRATSAPIARGRRAMSHPGNHVPDGSVCSGWWTFDPLVLAGLTTAVGLYTAGMLRMPRPQPARAVAFYDGILTSALALLSPI